MRLKRVLAVFLALTLVWGSSRISGMSRADEAAAEMTAAAVLDAPENSTPDVLPETGGGQDPKTPAGTPEDESAEAEEPEIVPMTDEPEDSTGEPDGAGETDAPGTVAPVVPDDGEPAGEADVLPEEAQSDETAGAEPADAEDIEETDGQAENPPAEMNAGEPADTDEASPAEELPVAGEPDDPSVPADLSDPADSPEPDDPEEPVEDPADGGNAADPEEGVPEEEQAPEGQETKEDQGTPGEPEDPEKLPAPEGQETQEAQEASGEPEAPEAPEQPQSPKNGQEPEEGDITEGALAPDAVPVQPQTPEYDQVSAEGGVTEGDPAPDDAPEQPEASGGESASDEEEEIVEVLFEAETELVVPDVDPEDPDALLLAYIEKLLREAVGPDGALRSVTIDDGRLNETCLKLYQKLKPQIEAIAAGDESNTEIEISYEDLGLPVSFTPQELGLTETQSLNSAARDILSQKLKVNYALVQLALLANCPYELYWYDKSEGAHVTATPAMIRVTRGGKTVSFKVKGPYMVRLPVTQAYSAGTYEVDASAVQKAKGSVIAAQQIVEKYKDLNDLEKLEAYRDEICRMVSYNGAAANGGQPYGDPWQLIYVFDEDSGTNVVCEGYAKAFQYLCDMTEFDGDVNCYTVSGRMEWETGSGNHMWNIVTMSNGQNYLVDLTNSDTGMLGADGTLFLNGYTDEDRGVYIFRNENGRTVRYKYNQNTTDLYTEEELTLAGSRYEVTCHLDLYPHHVLTERPYEAPGCTVAGRIRCWYCEQDGGYFTDARGTSRLTEEGMMIQPTGHQWGEWVVTTPPTCEEEGLETRVCGWNASHTETRPVAAPGHALEAVPRQAPTTLKDGRAAHWRCATCGQLFADAAGQVPVTAKDLRLAKLERTVVPVSEADVFGTERDAPDGWRIARIGELLDADEQVRFDALPLREQLAVVLAVLRSEAADAGTGAVADLAAELLAKDGRAEVFAAVFPMSGEEGETDTPMYEVVLVSCTDAQETRTVLIGLDEGNRMVLRPL